MILAPIVVLLYRSDQSSTTTHETERRYCTDKVEQLAKISLSQYIREVGRKFHGVTEEAIRDEKDTYSLNRSYNATWNFFGLM